MKVLSLLFIVFAFALGGSPAMGQSYYSPSKQCRLLIKKKHRGSHIRGQRRPLFGYRKNKKKSFSGAERSEPSVAASSTKKHDTSKKVATSAPSKKKRQEKTAEPVGLVDKNAILYSSQTEHGAQTAIEEEVSRNITEIEQGDEIHLDPLYLRDNNGQLEIVNMKPFLMAVEYGKRGRLLVVGGSVGNSEETIKRLDRFKEMLVNMGVKAELISTSGNSPMASEHSEKRIEFTIL